jgi:hypothetical protein
VRADDDDPAAQEETETDVEELVEEGAGGAAGDDGPPEAPSAKRRFLPSSIGLTVLLPPNVREIEAHLSWGDYRTEPPLSEDLLVAEEPATDAEAGKPERKGRPSVEWVRMPQQQSLRLAVRDGRGSPMWCPKAPPRSASAAA